MNHLFNFFNKLKETSSTLDKVAIIEDFFKTCSLFEEELFLLYTDPDVVFYLDKKSLDKANKMKPTSISNQTDISTMQFLNKLQTRELSGHEALQEYKNITQVLDESEKFVLDTIILKSPLGVGHKLINKAHNNINKCDFVRVFECQLANKYEEDKNYKVGSWYISRKLDGLRCVFRNNTLFTRQNKPIIGFDYLEKELKEISQKMNLDMMDGELYSHDIDFHTIQGIVTRNKNINEDDKKKIKFNMFACTGPEINCTDDMILKMNKICNNFYNGSVVVLQQNLIDNKSETIKKWTSEYVEQGYEGAMLRHPKLAYDYKRSDALLKVKFFKEDTFIITGIFNGDGRNDGKLGGFCIESLDGKIKSNVGSGFSDENRIEFNTEEMIGKKVEIKYFEVTEDNSLRFPVFLKIREDI